MQRHDKLPISCNTYESNLFYQAIQSKNFSLCFSDVTLKDTHLKERDWEWEVQMGGDEGRGMWNHKEGGVGAELR